MATLDNQQTWVPYENTKDCSQGFCSIDCPQWCYVIFPPPPPLGLSDDDAGSGTAFSPLVISIIGILASAFLLVSYYTVISKYCGTFDSLFSCIHRRRRPNGADGAPEEEPGQSGRQEAAAWHVSPSNGLEEALINKITVYRYKRCERVVDGTDCSVCLSEFREDESLRLLPKCSHAFHLQCIDTWLKSHSNCPLCRANIISTAANPVLLQLPAPPPPPDSENDSPLGEGEHNDEMVVVVEDIESVGELESNLGNHSSVSKFDSGDSEESYDIVEITDDDDDDERGGVRPSRRSISMDSSSQGRVSVADVLSMSMEDEFLAAKDRGLSVGAGSSRQCGGEHSKGSSRDRGLHCVMSPVSMKRSVSSGRFCFTRNGRGRNAVLPI